MTKMDVVRVGVIGLGGMGGRHARILAQRTQGARVVAAFDPDRARAEAVLAGTGGTLVDEAEAVIAHNEVDAVVIASPDATHAPLTLACLDAGKPVLCEKPLAQTAALARDVVDRELKLGRRLVQVGFMRRYDPAHVAVAQAIVQGRIGAPQLMRGWHRNEVSRPDITSDRVVTGSLVHDIDSARWLMRDDLVSVRVVGQRVGEDVAPGQCDLLLAEGTFADGRHALLEVFVNARFGYEVGVEVIGAMGMVATPNESNAIIKRDRSAGMDVAADWLVRFDTAYALQMAAWINGLRMGTPIDGADAWDGYAGLVCADACIQSLATGKAVAVTLGEKPALYDRESGTA